MIVIEMCDSLPKKSFSGIEFRVASPLKVYDAGVIGTGPAALALASELAVQGLSVVLIGPINAGFPNNYGVWMDEWCVHLGEFWSNFGRQCESIAC